MGKTKFNCDEMVERWMKEIPEPDLWDLKLLEAVAEAISRAYQQGVEDGKKTILDLRN